MQFETYPFEKLNLLLEKIEPNQTYAPLSLTIGEPQFATPQFILDALNDNASLLNKYPKTAGETELREAMLTYNKNRFNNWYLSILLSTSFCFNFLLNFNFNSKCLKPC